MKQDTVDQVLRDLIERKAEGIRRYGIPLRSDADRDLLQDAYEEALDLAIYLRAEIERRNEKS